MPLTIRASAVGLALLAALITPAQSPALTVGGRLAVSVNGGSAHTALGGPDSASNAPLQLSVTPGDLLEVLVLIDFGLPIRRYETSITASDPLSIDYVDGSAHDLSTLGFLFDPDATLQDGSPGAGEADSNPCLVGLCTAPSTNGLYKLSWVVSPGFAATGLRDITISIDSILFDRLEDSLDSARDTMSIVLIPEPATAALLLLGLAGLGALRRRSR